MWPMSALLTLAVLMTTEEKGEEAGFRQSVEIMPIGWALIFAGSFLALFLVTLAFRSQGKRH